MNHYTLPLFPLNLVVCPGGLMPLRIFEARYLDMVKLCLKNNSPFAIVTILSEDELQTNRNTIVKLPFADVGTVVEIAHADVATIGLMMIRCLGHHRVNIHAFTQQRDGLLIGDVTDIQNDLAVAIPKDLEQTSVSLKRLIESLPEQGITAEDMPVVAPYQFDDATWVGNRWIELLDLPLLQKQRLMQQDSPIVRLELIQDILLSDA